ncbi:MAG: glycosyl transferase family 2 [Deltaproteobacteria bacterium]|nr:glycosyl transferase family 2 [Deltaproteobacteria bacterium]
MLSELATGSSSWAMYLILGPYFVAALALSLWGLHRAALIRLYFRHQDANPALPEPIDDAECPQILVQLPVFNELHVVDRLLDATAALDWPRDRLRVQVLDDSVDLTSTTVARRVNQLRSQGLRIDHITRTNRAGFKAGALARGLECDPDKSPFVAVFDADFVPTPDFLRRSLRPLIHDPGLGMVQARWTHLNRSQGLLTRLQAILLDGHFFLEHGARSRSGRFFNFNGTAGVWRRRAIEDAGGWEGDTLCEDLDLSYRSQLAGWRFLFLQELCVPAELPTEVAAFKSQQHRWAKGSIQVARKLLPKLLRADLPWTVRLEAVIHLTANLAFVPMGVLLLLLPPAIAVRSGLPWLVGLLVDVPIFIFATVNLLVFYGIAERELRDGRWRSRLALIPLVLALGASLTVNNLRAVVEALTGHKSPFVRTPKGGDSGKSGYSTARDRLAWLEVAMGLYFAAAFVLFARDFAAALPFLGLFAFGFLLLGVGSLKAQSRPQGQTAAEESRQAAPKLAAHIPELEPMPARPSPPHGPERPRQSTKAAASR